MNQLHPHEDPGPNPLGESPFATPPVPPVDLPALQHPAAPNSLRTVDWLAGYVALQIGLIAVSALLPSRQIEYITCQLMFAVVLTESGLAGVWLALGPGPLGVRIVLAPLWLLVATALAGIVNRPSDAFPILLSIGVTLATLFTLLLLVLRWRWRLQLLRKDQIGGVAAFQFRIIHLIALTLVVSVLLALGRVAVENRLLVRNHEVVISAILGSVWALSLLPAVFVPLCQDGMTRLAWGLGLGFLLTSATAAMGGLLLMQIVPGFNGPSEFPYFIVSIPLAAYVLITVNLLVFRGSGQRLARAG